MSATIQIIEVLDRAEQGVTKPFLCRGDDGSLYYVKGRFAGFDSLCCEWIAGNLARTFGLSMPEFGVAEIPAALVEESSRADIRELGAGLAFASRRVEGAREVTWAEAESCPAESKAKLLVLDWWLHNEDRKLSPLGGNPNLLITTDEDEPTLWVFDFNLAFDSSFSIEAFRRAHVFGSVSDDLIASLRPSLENDMRSAISQSHSFFSSLPMEWLYLDGDDSLPVQLDKNLIMDILQRPFRQPEQFWTFR